MKKYMILELTVKNHPGVMSHITGLFARRAFNLEGILCSPFKDGEKSRMVLWVEEDKKVSQIVKQVRKLYDVLDVSFKKTSVNLESCFSTISI